MNCFISSTTRERPISISVSVSKKIKQQSVTGVLITVNTYTAWGGPVTPMMSPPTDGLGQGEVEEGRKLLLGYTPTCLIEWKAL